MLSYKKKLAEKAKSIFNKKAFRKHNGFDNISYQNNYVFVHVPKNAGTSISKTLGLGTTRHYTVDEYINILGKEHYQEMFSFAFVRNPFSRFLSLYNYARMEESYYHSSINPGKAIYGKHMDYDILKNSSLEDAANLLIEGKLIHNHPHNQWMPQSYWLKDSNDFLNIKFIGRVEDLHFSIRNLCSIIGLELSFNLKRVNVSSKSQDSYRDKFTSETREILEIYYKEDLETFNYEF